jgi:nucleoside-diphosphate-sugar epimerase
MGMNILLFGHTGSIGAYLLKRFSENGHSVLTAHYREADYFYDFREPDNLGG